MMGVLSGGVKQTNTQQMDTTSTYTTKEETKPLDPSNTTVYYYYIPFMREQMKILGKTGNTEYTTWMKGLQAMYDSMLRETDIIIPPEIHRVMSWFLDGKVVMMDSIVTVPGITLPIPQYKQSTVSSPSPWTKPFYKYEKVLTRKTNHKGKWNKPFANRVARPQVARLRVAPAAVAGAAGGSKKATTRRRRRATWNTRRNRR